MAQKYFEKDIIFYNYFQGAEKIVKTNDGYAIRGGTKQFQTDTWKALFVKTNDQLDTLFSKKITIDGADVFLEDFIQVEGGYALLILIDSIAGTYDWGTYFMRIDSLGNQLALHHVGNTTYSDLCRHIAYTPDKHYLISGGINISSGKVPYIIKLDSMGNKLWEQRFEYCAWGSEFKGGFAMPNNKYQFWGNYKLDFPLWGDWLMVETDTAGNFLNDQRYHPYTENDECAGLHNPIQTSDKGFAFIGAVDAYEKIAMKIDSLGSIAWISDNIYKNGGSWEILELADGGFIVGGTSNHQDGILGLDARIVKLSANGETLWMRDYGNSTNDYCFAITKAPDGGFVMAGQRYIPDINVSSIYLVKTNCMGLLTEPAAAFTTYQTGNSPLEVAFQNQSQYVYPDSIDGGYYVWDFGDGSSPYVCGRGHTPCAGDVVLHNYAAAGQYNVSLTVIVCSDTSTLKQDISVIWTGAEEVAAGTPHISVLPNPAKDLLHIETLGLAGSGQEAMQFTLYDLTGTAVRQASLSAVQPSATLKVADLPEGMYFWTCTSNHQAVRSGKITILR